MPTLRWTHSLPKILRHRATTPPPPQQTHPVSPPLTSPPGLHGVAGAPPFTHFTGGRKWNSQMGKTEKTHRKKLTPSTSHKLPSSPCPPDLTSLLGRTPQCHQISAIKSHSAATKNHQATFQIEQSLWHASIWSVTHASLWSVKHTSLLPVSSHFAINSLTLLGTVKISGHILRKIRDNLRLYCDYAQLGGKVEINEEMHQTITPSQYIGRYFTLQSADIPPMPKRTTFFITHQEESPLKPKRSNCFILSTGPYEHNSMQGQVDLLTNQASLESPQLQLHIVPIGL